MRQRFFTSTAQTRLIKNILANTYLPIYDTVQPGDYIIKNCKYIYNISLILCTKSGYLEGDGEFITLDDTFYWNTNKLNHTEKLKDATGFYDSKVHEWLGRYLRAYRDMVGINLMPFYNCFSGVYTSRFKLIPNSYVNTFTTSEQGTVNVIGTKIAVYEAEQSYDTYSQGTEDFNTKYVEQSGYKILQVPIKLNRTYTIAVDCDSTVMIAPAFINHGHLVKVKIGTEELDLTDILINNADNNGIISPISMEKTNTVFIDPFTIFINSKNQTLLNGIITKEDIGLTYEQLLQRYEKYLYLLIQLPKDNTSSTVILEGDYTNLEGRNIFSLEDMTITGHEDYADPLSATATVSITNINQNTLFRESYVSYLNIPELLFDNNGRLVSHISSIETAYSYGYIEYYFNKVTVDSNNYNLQIFSYVEIPEGTEFTVKWFNYPNSDIVTYPEDDFLENDKLLDNLLISKLSLLQFNDQKNYPFADRLIEYLTLNVIDSADEISDNVKRVQDFFGGRNKVDFVYGAWNNYLRTKIFLDSRNNNKVTHLDNIGYVDKDVESMMTNQNQSVNGPSTPLNRASAAYVQQQLRMNTQEMSVVNQPKISVISDKVKDNNLINPSSLTPVQKLIDINSME